MIGRAEIDAAAARIRAHVRETPVVALEPGALGLPGRLALKLEFLQHTGSFKPRGAFNRILSADVPASGVIAASGGNHGIAVAHAARRLGHAAEVFVPRTSAPVKIARIAELGATVRLAGESYAESLDAMRHRAAETGALEVHAYDQPEVLAGQGTVGREFEAQAPDLDTVLVACGGGGLIGGIAAWYAGRARIVGVEPVRAPTLARALGAGAPVDVATDGIAADSLGARRVGTLAFEIARRYVERAVLVEDDAIRAAQRALWRELRVLSEPGGAAAFAAVLARAYIPAAEERVGILVCGANTDPALLSETPPETPGAPRP